MRWLCSEMYFWAPFVMFPKRKKEEKKKTEKKKKMEKQTGVYIVLTRVHFYIFSCQVFFPQPVATEEEEKEEEEELQEKQTAQVVLVYYHNIGKRA